MANIEGQIVSDGEVQVVAFKLRNEEYGFSILNVQEIKGLTDITRVPFAPEFIKGVINLRGSVLPVIDLKRRLGLEDTPYTANTRIVIVQLDEVSVGMLVDAVTEVRTINADDIDSTRAVTGTDANSRFISGIGKVDGRLIIQLNISEIIGLTGEE
ncbi:chemotaxis protein CheW [Anaerovibrio lipolyticus]|jgi:purine-binding chemotaxis protein CheW|uniref:chemotaxis protein CheW n=1 Tax=Anaerovibrio lipolyticus TaxID=82374 RepID=UPI000489034A|nr:chemotaxis protein CheW [Anaerovibrio lipolyticus]